MEDKSNFIAHSMKCVFCASELEKPIRACCLAGQQAADEITRLRNLLAETLDEIEGIAKPNIGGCCTLQFGQVLNAIARRRTQEN